MYMNVPYKHSRHEHIHTQRKVEGWEVELVEASPAPEGAVKQTYISSLCSTEGATPRDGFFNVDILLVGGRIHLQLLLEKATYFALISSHQCTYVVLA